MSAERLREAAVKLRKLADPIAAPIAEDRWFSEHEMRWALRNEFSGYERTLESADFIAVMTPRVALALAELLADTARAIESTGREWPHAFTAEHTVADAILGSDT